MLSIGEFSRVTQLSVKALRLYHEKGLLIPDRIDFDSKYRYYRSRAVEKAHTIKRLKDMGFSLGEIKTILLEYNDDKQMTEAVEKKQKAVEETIRQYMEIKKNLSMFLQSAQSDQGIETANTVPHINKEILPDILVCGIRFKGKYQDVGRYMGPLFKKVGRSAVGKPFSLYYDGDYKEDDADIEVCIEVKKRVDIDGFHCRQLPGGKVLTLTHRGPYSTLGDSYQKLFEYCRGQNQNIILPIREQYLKGPGFVFAGNPKKYLTRIMIHIGDFNGGFSGEFPGEFTG